MLRKIGNKLERIEEEIFEGNSAEVVRDISNVKQEIINFRKIVRPQRSAFQDLERNKARYMAEDLDIYFEDINDASERVWDMLENYKEVVEALEGTNEAQIAHRTNETFRVLTAISVIVLPLTLIASIWGMNVGVPGEQDTAAFWAIIVVMLTLLGGMVALLPPPGLVVSDPALAERRLTEIAALERPAEAKRMLVIVNPYATTMSVRLKNLVVYALQGRYDVQAIETEHRGHATELIVAATEEKFDVVAAFGGDGTVNEVANGLAGTGTPLTILPGGSNNVFAKMLGIPNDVVDATEHLLGLADRWEPRAVDMGRINGRWFTFAAGVGLDASVVERVDAHPHLKAKYGAWYYTEAAVVTFLRKYVVNPPRLEIEIGGERVPGVSAFFQNGDAVHVLQEPAGQPRRGRVAGLRRPRRRHAHPRPPVRRPDGHVPRPVRRGADRQAQGHPRVRRDPRGDRAIGRRPAGPAPGRRRPHERRDRRRAGGRARRAPRRELTCAGVTRALMRGTGWDARSPSACSPAAGTRLRAAEPDREQIEAVMTGLAARGRRRRRGVRPPRGRRPEGPGATLAGRLVVPGVDQRTRGPRRSRAQVRPARGPRDDRRHDGEGDGRERRHDPAREAAARGRSPSSPPAAATPISSRPSASPAA